MEVEEASSAERVLCLVVAKADVQRMQDALKSLGLASANYKVSQSSHSGDEGKMLMPLKEDADLDEVRSALSSSAVESRLVVASTLALLKPLAKGAESGIDKIRSDLKVSYKWSEKEVSSVPEKWLKYGDILVLFSEADDVLGDPDQLLEVFRKTDKKLRCIVLHKGKIEGELREPQMAMLTKGQSSETIHTENGFKYKFDVTKVMFAPGNGTERMRFSKMRLTKPEVIVDMFAGLGYFTIPLSYANKDKILRYVAMEKNPNSWFYLKQNLVLNGVEDKVEAVNGDNRLICDDLKSKCDRILMGYLPNTKDFIPRALELANRDHCLVHYHYLAKKEEAREIATADFQDCFASCGFPNAAMEIVEVSKVKNYAPKLLHFCTDIIIKLQ